MDRISFKDQVVIITGASSGIGKAVSLRLAEQGAWLGLTARDASRLEVLASECQNLGGKACVLTGDISDEVHCQSLVERTIQEYGRLDMLVNNAGFGVGARFQDFSDLNLFMRVMAVNFNGALYCTFYAMPHLIQSRGRVVNVSSLAGKFPLPFNTPYIASKFALSGFSDTLRMELAKQGVSVTVIYPSWVVTEFHERFMDKTAQPTGPRGRKIYTKSTMTADRCAQIIVKAALKRQREVIMPPGRLALWLKLLAPVLMEKIIIDRFFRPAVRRVAREKETPESPGKF
jgi:short-subunit dehydrogenase